MEIESAGIHLRSTVYRAAFGCESRLDLYSFRRVPSHVLLPRTFAQSHTPARRKLDNLFGTN